MLDTFTTIDQENYRWLFVTINHTKQTKAFKLLHKDTRYKDTHTESLAAYTFIYNALPSFLQEQASHPDTMCAHEAFRQLLPLIRLAKTIRITHT